MLTITIQDTNTERYTYTASSNILGRRYDNIAEYITVTKPESETGRDCIMIVTYGDTVVDHIPVGDTPIAITSNLSQYASVKIGFAFLGADGYIKNSEVKTFTFLPAQKPDGFVPLPPEQKTTIDYLISHGFTGAKLENNILSFTNAAGEAVAGIKLSGFIQEQADWNETDTTAETYIKNKPTKLSEFTDDLGAYVKPESGIPETDLSAEVQEKLNASGGDTAVNLLQSSVTANRQAGVTEGDMVNLGYSLGLELGKQYKVKYKFNDTEYSAIATYNNAEDGLTTPENVPILNQFLTITGTDYSYDYPLPITGDWKGATDYGIIFISDGYKIIGDQEYEADTNNASLYVRALGSGQNSNAVSIEILSIEEHTEIVADKVQNKLTITVNGEDKEYDGSRAVDVSINTTTGKNILKSDVTFAEVGGGVGVSVLDYALNLEVGKAYKLKWGISGEQYSQTTYCWLRNEQIQLGTFGSGDGGGEPILLIPNDPESGVMLVADKYYRNPDTGETAPSENNASIVVTGYVSTLKLISIEDAGVYIPVPTTADVGKILKVSAYGHYELVEP